MNAPRLVFTFFGVLFQPLYVLMLLMYLDEIQREEVLLAQVLDAGILALGIVFLLIQLAMMWMVWKRPPSAPLRSTFFAGLVVWFFLEVVLSYWWCFVTGADPITQHTPFVLVFLVFNAAQLWSLRRLGVLSRQNA